MFGGVLAFLPQGVEFVEEHDHGDGFGEVEHLAEVGRRLAEKGRDGAVGANDGERPAELAGDGLGRQRLAATGRSAKQDAIARTQTVRPQHFLTVVLPENPLDQRAGFRATARRPRYGGRARARTAAECPARDPPGWSRQGFAAPARTVCGRERPASVRNSTNQRPASLAAASIQSPMLA